MKHRLSLAIAVALAVAAAGCSTQKSSTSQNEELDAIAVTADSETRKSEADLVFDEPTEAMPAPEPATVESSYRDGAAAPPPPRAQPAPIVEPARTRAGHSEALQRDKQRTTYKPNADGLGQVMAYPYSSDANQQTIYSEPANRENYADLESNPVLRVAEQPVSTFSIDVDTGSYANVRRMLNQGQLPPSDAVRAEELINYFDYGYAPPASAEIPFAVTTEIAPAPWNTRRHLLLVGIKGYEVPASAIPAANLVFLIDTSGSMQSPDKIELLKQSFALMTEQLRPQDRVAIIAYAGSAGLVLPSTPGSKKKTILAALQKLEAGGSTNGGEGIELAYAMATANFIKNGVNRVILATDGDFNVGTVSVDALKTLVAARRERGIALTTLGFGTGNYNDELSEQLADVGNGNHAYIDTLNEGRKVLVEELSSTLLTIAKDVKIQLEFNPAVVAEYRLIGYENRLLRREDFNNDRIDAGEIGAGHDVTALYEIALVGSGGERSDPLRYGAGESGAQGEQGELGFLRLRYKQPDEDKSQLIETPIRRSAIKSEPSERLAFAAAVAAFADALRGGANIGEFAFKDIAALAKRVEGSDAYGYRQEFVQLIDKAGQLRAPQGTTQIAH